MKVLCTICARGGSKSVKNKNLKKINKKPLIDITLTQAIKSKIFSNIVVSSDSDKILNVSKKHKVILHKRSKKLSSDKSPKIPVIRDALKFAEKKTKNKYDYIIDLDVTSPLRNILDIKKSFLKFLKNKNSNLFTITEARRNPYFNMIEISNNKIKICKKNIKPFVRRQDAPKVFELNASINIWKRNWLIKSDKLISKKTGYYFMPMQRSMDIDSYHDFKIVEYLLK
jgi:CMP-N,N'-diacetyllegionaminic acid synthase